MGLHFVTFTAFTANELLALIAVGTPAFAQSQEDLKAKINKLERQLDALKRQVQSNEEAAAAKAKAGPVLTVEADGVVFRSPDKNFLLRLRARRFRAMRAFIPAGHPERPMTLF